MRSERLQVSQWIGHPLGNVDNGLTSVSPFLIHMNLSVEQLTDIKAAVRFYQQHHISIRNPRYLEYEILLDELDKALLNENLPRHRRRNADPEAECNGSDRRRNNEPDTDPKVGLTS